MILKQIYDLLQNIESLYVGLKFLKAFEILILIYPYSQESLRIYLYSMIHLFYRLNSKKLRPINFSCNLSICIIASIIQVYNKLKHMFFFEAHKMKRLSSKILIQMGYKD